MKSIGRRRFLQASSLGVIALTLRSLGLPAPELFAGTPGGAAPTSDGGEYGDWRDVYREAWTWDRMVRGTHTNANCVSACAWNLYVREGIVWREEQAGTYDDGCTDCPDFNPRGCQKGACASDLALSATRLRYPLKSVGARGGGKWKRIPWREAVDEVAGGIIEAVERDGGHGLIAEFGPEVDYGPNSAGALRFFKMLGIPVADNMAMIGDVAFGGTITLGTPHTDGSSDDWFRSDYIVLWAFNPVSTRIPDAHFLNEARYRGARIVSIAPDYNPSSIHADLWISPRPGTDAALALSAVQVILEEGSHAPDYMREQTDLPLLIRTDNARFLRPGDVGLQGAEADRFYAWDERASKPVLAPGCPAAGDESIDWGGVRVALEGTWRVKTSDGPTIPVETVFTRLKRRLDADYRPEQAEVITGVPAGTIRRFALEFARSRASLILSQFGSCKFYHSDLMQRAQILLASVTGNIGKAGGGWRSGAFVGMEGMPLLAMKKNLGLLDLIVLATRNYFRDPEENVADFSRYFVPAGLWHHVHGGLEKQASVPAYGDEMLESGPAPYVREALDKKWFPVDRDRTPSALISVFSNVLRHSRNGSQLLTHLWPKLSMVVNIDFRMSQTGLHSDILLPAAGWYEKVGFKYIPSLVPYVTIGDRAVEPYVESKPEWAIFYSIAESVARKARDAGLGSYRDYLGVERRLGELEDEFSDDGRFGPSDEDKLAEFILMVSSASKGTDLETLRSLGTKRISALGPPGGTNGIYSDYSEGEPVVPMKWFVEGKRPYPTLTGRQQFYIDHRWFLDLDEALPRFKPPPAVGGDFPLTLSGGHTRWSIHAIWRDHVLMLRLQRGEPVVLLGKEDAERRGINDHERVRVYNDVSSVVAHAKVAPGFPPGFATVYHAWEPYQFNGRRSHQDLAPAPPKVTQLVGDYGHLAWSFAHYEPGQVDRDTRVEVERVKSATT